MKIHIIIARTCFGLRLSSGIVQIVQNLANITFLLKHSVKLRRILCGDVSACLEMACVLFVVQIAVCTTNITHAISRHAATSPHTHTHYTTT